MATDTYPIDHPTTPGRYEAESFPLSSRYDPYEVTEDGNLHEVNSGTLNPVEDFERFHFERKYGPFRRIDADGNPLPITPHVIGLVGKKRTGKDTTARALAEHGYTPAAFADPLRDMALAIDPVVGADRRGDFIRYSDALATYGYEEAKERFPEFRRFLQRLGTEGVREVLGAKYGLRDLIGDDLWIVLAEQRIQAADIPLVFTDVRFPNEAALIERYGDTVRIVRPSLPASTDEHPSETALDNYDTRETLVNDSTPEGLAATVDALLSRLKG
ncbi:hypothetical protein J2Y69_003355 [Microbacterium resistens]|uniref:Deoxynucleoside monophosphate kinase n=1 Tax=Microbacterium resistens TaxID=156977 RepID=A0ABU1SGM0_9MICO|nr:hypothetical protein [Microbacterium resistens]MDR6868731.1 hypothetical protein [Microbacterium resistens]